MKKYKWRTYTMLTMIYILMMMGLGLLGFGALFMLFLGKWSEKINSLNRSSDKNEKLEELRLKNEAQMLENEAKKLEIAYMDRQIKLLEEENKKYDSIINSR